MDASAITPPVVAITPADASDGESGQGLVEYAVILMLVALVVLGVLALLGTSVDALLQNVAGAFP